MTQAPARLVYTDTNNDEQVIGRFLPQDVTNGSISTFTIDEDAADYKRVIIEGGPSLQQNMPTGLNDFGTSEPEIRVEIDEKQDGTWEERLRVYPEKAGTTDERGRYKNKNLWGFKKYYGEDDVEVTADTNGPITTNIEDAVDALLPTGYTAVYPGDITAPTVSNYTYKGARQQAFKEIQEDYDHFIIFTDETDGSGDIEVLVQPTGYGGVVTSIERGVDTLHYDYWEKNDLSNVVSKVRVIGTDSSNQTVDETFEAGTGDLSDLPSADRDRFKQVHVDYTINASDAEEIARGIIDPSGTEHGAIESDLRPQSTLNESIGILDSSRNIDDVFTVVKQKDYLHQGVTYYSFEFERESTKQERNKWREHDNTRAKVYPSQTTDVGNQDFTGDTGSAPSDTATTGGVDNDPSDTNAIGGIRKHTNADLDANTEFETVTGVNISSSGWTSVATVSNISNDSLFHQINVIIEDISSSSNLDIAVVIDNEIVVAHWTPQDVGTQNHDSLTSGTIGDDGYWNQDTLVLPVDWTGSSVDYTLYFSTKGGGSPDVDVTLAATEINHFHPDDIDTQDNDHPHGDNIDTDDFQHGGTGDAAGQHGASGTTDGKNVNVATEDKTDR